MMYLINIYVSILDIRLGSVAVISQRCTSRDFLRIFCDVFRDFLLRLRWFRAPQRLSTTFRQVFERLLRL